MIPLHDKVLIRPDPVVTETASGLALVEDWPQETTGTVLAIPAQHPDRADAEALAALATHHGLEDVAAFLLRLTARPSELAVGDRVVFPQNVGQEMQINETRVFVMRERDVLAVLEH